MDKDLMDQCRDSSDVGQSIELGFRGLTHKVSALQQKVASLKGDTVLSPAHHAYIKQMVDDLAGAFSAAPHAIVENTSVKLPEPEVIEDDMEREEGLEEAKDGVPGAKD